jgi:hypothetical protein
MPVHAELCEMMESISADQVSLATHHLPLVTFYGCNGLRKRYRLKEQL